MCIRDRASSKCESGERRVDVVELMAFARIYGVPINFFYGSVGPSQDRH